jgi:3'(2'), 5'-bisphosphate nucleotidase
VTFDRELQVAQELARRAGDVILEHYRAGVSVDYKDDAGQDPVTAADRDANQVIVDGLSRAFPDDAVLAEESPDTGNRRSRSRLWCVDPLDGTRDFIDRTGDFVVMIGLAIDGEARAGVVYQPTEDVMVWGAVGEAWVDRAGDAARIHPTTTTKPRAATMVVSRSHRSKTVTGVAERLGVVREEPVGSVGLKVARVAEGAADIYVSVSTRTQEWDACAPEAILRAAGGRMTDVTGRPLRYNKETTETPRGMLASNGPLHEACVEALGPVSEARGWL